MAELVQASERVLLAAFGLSILLGMVLHRSHFCTMGAVSDWILMGSLRRARQWALAVAVAMLGFGTLAASGQISPLNTIYNTPTLPWLAFVLGGLMFGMGMVLASGCLSRSLVRLGAGNLKSLVVLLVAGLAALATLRGLLAVVRVKVFEPVALDWGAGPFVAQWWMQWSGTSLPLSALLAAFTVSAALMAWVLASPDMRSKASCLFPVVTGLLVVAMWWVSGVMGFVPEHPETLEAVFLASGSGRMESVSLSAPAALWIDGLAYFSDGTKRLTLGMVMMPGILTGATLSAVHQGSFRWESFAGTADLVRHLTGAVLMGVGGVMAMGCTFGQGLSGLSTLSLGSMLVLAGLLAGAVITLKWQLRHAD
ncbi:MAG: YeeE/YedE family protein [Limnohabitans sp.]